MGKGKIISKILFTLYVMAVAFVCFVKFDSGVDMGMLWLGIPLDKIIHFCMFLPFSFLMYLAFCKRDWHPVSILLFLALTALVGGILAGATEMVQGILKYRSADRLDFRADCIGILVGAIITFVIALFLKKR